MTIATALHQDVVQRPECLGNETLTISSFTYTDVEPSISSQYIVNRATGGAAVTYNENDKSTWPLPGDTVTATHLISNNKNDIVNEMSIPFRVPTAKINGKTVTPTNLLGGQNETNIFNGTMSGSDLVLRDLTLPRTTGTSQGSSARQASVTYDYEIPANTAVTTTSTIEDELLVGSAIMTNTSSAGTVRIGGYPIASASNIQIKKGSSDSGTWSVLNGLTYQGYDGDQTAGNFTVTVTENGRTITELDTNSSGTHTLTYAVSDNRFTQAVDSSGTVTQHATTTFTRTVTVLSGNLSADEQYAVKGDNFSMFLSKLDQLDKDYFIEKSNAVGTNPDGSQNQYASSFTVVGVCDLTGQDEDVSYADLTYEGDLSTIASWNRAGLYAVKFYYRAGNEEAARAYCYVTITVINDQASLSGDGENAVNAQDMVIKADAAKTLFQGLSESQLGTLLSGADYMAAEATSNSKTVTAQVSFQRGDPDRIRSGQEGAYDVTFYVGNSGVSRAEKTVTLTIVPSENAVVDEKGNALVSVNSKTISASEGAAILYEDKLISLMEARGFQNGSEVVPNLTIADGKTISDFGTPGTYQITFFVDEKEAPTVRKTVTLTVVKDGITIVGDYSVSAVDTTLTTEQAEAAFAQVTDTAGFDAKLIEVLSAEGKYQGEDYTLTVSYEDGIQTDVLDGKLGTYRITFHCGTASVVARLYIAENGQTIVGTSAVKAFPKIFSSTTAKSLFSDVSFRNTQPLRDAMNASGSAQGTSVTVGVSDGGQEGYRTGTVGSYTITFSAGSSSDPANYAQRAVDLRVVGDQVVVASNNAAALDVKDGAISDVNAENWDNVIAAFQEMLIEGYKVEGNQVVTLTDADSYLLSDEDRAAISAGRAGEYAVTFVIGGAEKTATLGVYGTKPAVKPDPDDASKYVILIPSTDGLTGTADDLVVRPVDASGNPVTDQATLERMIQTDNTVIVPRGGAVTLPEADPTLTVTVTGPFTVQPEGTVVIRKGSSATLDPEDESHPNPVKGPARITADGTVYQGADEGAGSDPDVKPDPDPSPSPSPSGDSVIVLPGKDGVTGDSDDPVVKPKDSEGNQITDSQELNKLIQEDGSVKLPYGGTVLLPGSDMKMYTEDDVTVEVTGPCTVQPSGTVAIPADSSAALTVANQEGVTAVVGPATIDPDGTVHQGKDQGADNNPIVKPDPGGDGGEGGGGTGGEGGGDNVIVLPGKDDVTGDSDDPVIRPFDKNGSILTDADALAKLIQTDGSVKLPYGGIILLPGPDGEMYSYDDVTAEVHGPCVVQTDGTVAVQNGSTATLTFAETGNVVSVTGPAIIDPDGTVHQGKDEGADNNPVVKPDPGGDGGEGGEGGEGSGDNVIVLPGKDDVTGDQDDPVVKPNDNEGNPITDKDKLEELVQPDGSVELPYGGTVLLPGPDGEMYTKDDVTVVVTGHGQVRPDGSVVIYEGSSATLTPGNTTYPNPVEGLAVIAPDGTVSKKDDGVDEKPVVKPDPDNPDDNVIVVPGKGDVTGDGNDPQVKPGDGEGGTVTDKDQLEELVQPDGSVELPYGGTITLPGEDGRMGTADDVTVVVTGPCTIKPDGTVAIPAGSTAVLTPEDKDHPNPVKGPVLIGVDGKVDSEGLDSKPVVKPDPTDPDNPDNNVIVLPGKDDVTGDGDDPVVKPGDGEGGTVTDQDKLEEMIQPDGSVKLPNGGTILLPGPDGKMNTDDDVTVVVTGPCVVLPDGSVAIYEGSSAKLSPEDAEHPNDIAGPATIAPDGTVKQGKDEGVDTKPVVTPPNPNKPDNNEIVLPGKDGLTGDSDDPVIRPSDGAGGTVTDKDQLEGMIQPDGSVDLPHGGTVVLPDGTRVEITGPAEVSPDGTVTLPSGSSAVVKHPDGTRETVTGPATIQPDGTVIKASTPGETIWSGSYDEISVARYTLTFHTNGGSAIDPVTRTNGTLLRLSSYTTTREGYTFAGWYSDAALTVRVTSVSLTRNTEVYAKWTWNSPFTDLAADAYYWDAVLWAVEQGVTQGTSATTFSPEIPCDRAQAVTFLWRAAGSPAPAGSAMPFTDVAADAYYYTAVLWAVEQGVTQGTSATTFSPDGVCTRAQIVTFLWRAQNSPAPGVGDLFTDVAVDSYYFNAVLWASQTGVTRGTSFSATAATFSPDAVCDRAQVVTFLYRCLAQSAQA
jgi:uncharacterized repeat protein (TIGR02543 family)